jgi:hypothetical protein
MWCDEMQFGGNFDTQLFLYVLNKNQFQTKIKNSKSIYLFFYLFSIFYIHFDVILFIF